MTDYVLEILDGDRAGEIFALHAEPLTFGRRPGNEIVLKDEKCSGRHATIILEDGQWVLRDLDSTNGTLMDGRRIDEVGLTANDIFQVGITRVAFKEKDAPTPTDSMSVKKVDRATMAQGRRGGGVGILLGLVVLLGAGAGWFFFLREEKTGGAGRTVRSPLTVAGNMLKGGDCEAEEKPLLARVSGVGFEPDFGAGSAHSGARSLLATLGEDAVDHHALARSEPITVSAGGGVLVRAYLQTTGTGKAAIRARFTSSSQELPMVLFTGTTPAAFDGYTEVSLDLGVPSGCDRVAVEVLGLLPDNEATVAVDDISVVTSAAKGGAVQTRAGQRITWVGSALRIDADGPVLLGLRPMTDEPILQKLAGEGLLALSDVGMGLQVTDAEGALSCKVTGGAGVTLRFEPGTAAGGLLVRKGDEPFVNRGATLDESVEEVLFGYQSRRLMLTLPGGGAVKAGPGARAFEITIPGAAAFQLVHDFAAQRATARQQLAAARTAAEEQKFKAALDGLQTLLSTVPHDDQVAADAAKLRATVLEGLGASLRRLQADLDEAIYFDSLRGYRRLKQRMDALVARYGEERLLQKKSVVAIQEEVTKRIQKIEAESGAEVKAKLDVLAEVYGKSHPTMGKLIETYIAKFLPQSAGTPEEGK